MNKNDFYSKEIYCDQMFIDYVRGKYRINEANISNNHQNLLLIYSYEWFDHIDNYRKMKFHPYLKKQDFMEIEKISKVSYKMVFIFNAIYFGLKFRKKKLFSLDEFVTNFSRTMPFILMSLLIQIASINYYISYSYPHYTKLDLDREKLKKGLIANKILNSDGNINAYSDSEIDNFIEKHFHQRFYI